MVARPGAAGVAFGERGPRCPVRGPPSAEPPRGAKPSAPGAAGRGCGAAGADKGGARGCPAAAEGTRRRFRAARVTFPADAPSAPAPASPRLGWRLHLRRPEWGFRVPRASQVPRGRAAGATALCGGREAPPKGEQEVPPEEKMLIFSVCGRCRLLPVPERKTVVAARAAESLDSNEGHTVQAGAEEERGGLCTSGCDGFRRLLGPAPHPLRRCALSRPP